MPDQIYIEEDSHTITVVDENPTIVIDEEDLEIVEVAEQGPEGAPGTPGPQGPEGPQGPQGPIGADATYTHSQVIPSNIWTITHNMGKMPSVAVVDSAGTEVEGLIRYLSLNQLEIIFSAEFAGEAYLN